MFPYEVKKKEVKNFFKFVNEDKNFLASAITTPLKINSFSYAIPGDIISKKSESFNLIIKKKNKIYGFNTDILALNKIIENLKTKKILIIGLGGVGLALYKVLRNKYKKIYTLSRNKKIKNDKKVESYRNLKELDFKNIDLIINCTPLGSDLKDSFLSKSPIDEKYFNIIKKNKTKILDIVYKPKKNLLSRLCKKYKVKYMNGIEMNTLQAEIALNKINKSLKK